MSPGSFSVMNFISVKSTSTCPYSLQSLQLLLFSVSTIIGTMLFSPSHPILSLLSSYQLLKMESSFFSWMQANTKFAQIDLTYSAIYNSSLGIDPLNNSMMFPKYPYPISAKWSPKFSTLRPTRVCQDCSPKDSSTLLLCFRLLTYGKVSTRMPLLVCPNQTLS